MGLFDKHDLSVGDRVRVKPDVWLPLWESCQLTTATPDGTICAVDGTRRSGKILVRHDKGEDFGEGMISELHRNPNQLEKV